MSDTFVDWKTIQIDAETVAQKLMEKNTKWKGLIAVTRGGMIPACLIARELGITLIETFCIATYDNMEQKEAEISKALNLPDDGENWLVVDDLVDSGETFEIIRKHLPKAFFVTLYAKPKGAKQSDLFLKEYDQASWIHFPWEVDPQNSTPKGY